jgi:hypothetical protein
MSRIAVRTTSAVLAAAATLSVMKGIAVLAAVGSPARLGVEVTATARHASPVEVASSPAERSPL